jgi:mitogen-activated protein kinase 15
VWKVRCRESKTIFAIKKVFLAFQDDTDAQRVYREISLLLKLRSDLVVRLKQVLPSDNSTDIYLLFEYMESDIFQAIKNRVLDPTHKKFIVYQLACAMKYLHSAGVVHRDLKPSNVLINSNCDIKLCDFGLSRSMASEYFNRPIMTEFIATRWYRAPEVLLGSRSYSTKSDMWSLGCLIYELYSRRTLLPGESTIDQITKILEFKGKPTPSEI